MKHILAHTLIIIVIFTVVIYAISRDVYAGVSDYISGVGSKKRLTVRGVQI